MRVRPGAWVSALFILGALSFAPAAFGQTWSNVTVIDKSGWKYEGVTIQVEPGARAIKLIDPSGGHKYIAASRVRVIKSGDGRTITREVLGALTATGGGEGATSGEEPDSSATESGVPEAQYSGETKPPRAGRGTLLFGPPFRAALSGFVGYGVPSGDWFESLDGGIWIGGRGRVAIADNVFLGLWIGRQSLGVGSELPSGTELHLTEYYATLGTMIVPDRRNSSFLYIECGLGFADHSASYEGYGTIWDEAKFSVFSAAGGVIPLSDPIGVDAQVNVRITGGEESTGILWGFDIGFVVLIGR